MEVMKFLVLCFIFMSSCSAVENQTLDFEKEIKIQKREKQYLLEDESSDGPEQKRDERQSSPSRMNLVDPNIKPKPVNMRLQPNILTKPVKPVLKPAVLTKPMNIGIDTTPQRIPTKIPVVLKTAKVTPGPAHALRLKMIENRKNNSILNEENVGTNKENILSANSTNMEDQLIPSKEVNLPFTKEDRVTSNLEGRMSPNKEEEVISNQESKVIKDGKVILNKDGRVISNKVEKVAFNKDKNNILDRDGKDTSNEEEKFVPKPAANVDANFKKENGEVASEDVPKSTHFFEDDADSLPELKKQSKIENHSDKNKDVTSKIKEIPTIKIVKNKPKNDEVKHQENDDLDPNIVRFSNGTHVITIKKIHNENSRRVGQMTEPRIHIEERILNGRPAKPSLPDLPCIDEPQKIPSSCVESEENSIIMAVFGDNKKKEEKHNEHIDPDAKGNKDKDSGNCITVTNHKYEEFEERTTIPPPVSSITCDDASRRPWNYLQNFQNLYYNPYNQNIYDQCRTYYDIPKNDPNIQNQCNDPIYVQAYTNENQPNYNFDYSNADQPEIDVSANYPEILRSDNTLDRIWRAWKDVEIKIRKNQLRDEPTDIDIRRNLADCSSNNAELIGKVPIPYANQPIGLNGYYNNQNSALIYPYMNPTYRYMR